MSPRFRYPDPKNDLLNTINATRIITSTYGIDSIKNIEENFVEGNLPILPLTAANPFLI
jgi:hypothetical protein